MGNFIDRFNNVIDYNPIELRKINFEHTYISFDYLSKNPHLKKYIINENRI
jgi:hypothetical protein